MVHISISTIILAVLAFVGPVLAAPIGDIKELGAREQIGSPLHHRIEVARGTEPVVSYRRDVNDFVFGRAIDGQGNIRSKRGFYDADKETVHQDHSDKTSTDMGKDSSNKDNKVPNRRDVKDGYWFIRDFDEDKYWG